MLPLKVVFQKFQIIDVARAKMELERTERQKQNAKSREDLIKSEMEIVKLLNQIRVGEKK